jgi:hypothetical protein
MPGQDETFRPCIFWTYSGCGLKFAERPAECRILKPGATECRIAPEDVTPFLSRGWEALVVEGDVPSLALAWAPYEQLLRSVVRACDRRAARAAREKRMKHASEPASLRGGGEGRDDDGQEDGVNNCETISDRAVRVGVRIGDHRLAPDGAEHHLVRVIRFTDEGVRVALGGHDFGLECGWDLAPEEVAAWRIAEQRAVHSTHNPHPYREGTA